MTRRVIRVYCTRLDCALISFQPFTIMPEPTATISVTSKDPNKKKEEKQAESGKAQAAKKKGDEKEGEDLVRTHCECARIVTYCLAW